MWLKSRWDSPDMHDRPVSWIFADALVLKRHQTIDNYHVNSVVTSGLEIAPQNHSKIFVLRSNCLREAWRSKHIWCLIHWGRVTHICVDNLTIIGSDNGLSPGRHQAIIWTNAGILLIEPLGTNFSEILIEIHTLWFKKMDLKISSAK